MAYTGDHQEKEQCDHCSHPRWQVPNLTVNTTDSDEETSNTLKVPFKRYLHIPLAPRLEYQYHSPRRAHTLQSYCRPYYDHPIDRSFDPINDWWSGSRYKDLRRQGFFSQPTDIAFAIHYDGVQAINRSSHSVSPVILIMYNLPPTTRYQRSNILLSHLIPGPDEPKNLSSFLRPLVDELIELGNGIQVFDSFNRRDFTLKAYAVIAGG